MHTSRSRRARWLGAAGSVAIAASLLPLTPAPASAAAASAPAPASTISPGEIVPGELLVRFAPTATAARRLAVADRLSGTLRRSLPAPGLQLLAVPAGREAAAARAAGRLDEVVYAEPAYRRQVLSHEGEASWGVTATNAPTAWAGPVGMTGSGVRVAVIDTGVDATHPDLAGRVAAGHNAVDGTEEVADDCDHGTAVAGIIAANHDGSGLVGVAPEATVVPVKVTDDACEITTTSVVDAVAWAASASDGNADVINLSFGGDFPSRAELDAIAEAITSGVSVVAAAGNRGGAAPSFPAAYPGVIAVGALQQAAAGGGAVEWADFSSWGKVDLAAPGADLAVLVAGGGRAEHFWSGTSLATPHAAGVLALLTEASGNDDPTFLRHVLLGTATDVGAEGVDLRTGHGAVDADAAISALTTTAGMLTVELPERLLPGNGGTEAGASRIDLTAHVSTVAGAPAPLQTVTFTTDEPTIASTPSAQTDAAGEATTHLSSTATPGSTTVSVTSGGLTRAVELLVLDADDGIPGVPLTGAVSSAVDADDDRHDVFAVDLLEGERLDATITPGPGALVAAAVFDATATRVDWDLPEASKLADDTTGPVTLSYPVPADGRYYLDILGDGAYDLTPAVQVPGQITDLSLSSSTITPNGDGSGDTLKVSLTNTASGSVALEFVNATGAIVRRKSFGRIGPSVQTFTWNGNDDAGTLVPDGPYTVRAAWRNGLRVSSSTRSVTVDGRRPSVTSLTAGPNPFYPARDGYKDKFKLSFTPSEPAAVSVRFYPDGSRTAIKTFTSSLSGTRRSIEWAGRRTDGSLLPAGVYDFTIALVDAVGNRTVTPRREVTLSHRALVTKTATLTKNGVDAYLADANTCGTVSPAGSASSTGIVLSVDDCTADADLAYAAWAFRAPSAVSYQKVKVEVYGRSPRSPATTLGVFGRNTSTGTDDLLGEIATTTLGWHAVPTVGPAFVAPDRTIDLVAAVADALPRNRFDLHKVRVTVTYRVLG